jgi:hypothetical protein
VLYFGRDSLSWIYRDLDTGNLVIHFPDGTEQITAGGGGSSSIPAAEALTIASGVITPTLPSGLYCNLAVSGEGGVADDLTRIAAPTSAWIGKRAVVRMAGAGTITIKKGADLIAKNDFGEDSVYDNADFECIAVNTWIMISRSDNV